MRRTLYTSVSSNPGKIEREREKRHSRDKLQYSNVFNIIIRRTAKYNCVVISETKIFPYKILYAFRRSRANNDFFFLYLKRCCALNELFSLYLLFYLTKKKKIINVPEKLTV